MLDKITYSLKRIIQKLGISADSPSLAVESKTSRQQYTIFLLVGIPAMMVFGIINLSRGNYLLVFFILASLCSILAGYFLLRKTDDGRLVYRINCGIFAILLLYMLIIGGEGGSKILWIYTFPLLLFFLMGKKEGLLWCMASLLILLLMFWGPLQRVVVFEYMPQFKTRFIIVYVMISSLTFWFEFYRNQFRLHSDEKNDKLEQEKRKLENEINERRRLEEKLRLLATTDSLTGIANRRRFMELAGNELQRLRRYEDHKLTMALLDIDHFKRVNDTYGHPIGDKVLQVLAEFCRNYLRATDILGRIGGEEFAMVLVEADVSKAQVATDRLRQKISEIRLPVGGKELQFTVSIGISSAQKDGDSLESIMKRADEALYQAKKRGRNRVVTL